MKRQTDECHRMLAAETVHETDTPDSGFERLFQNYGTMYFTTENLFPT